MALTTHSSLFAFVLCLDIYLGFADKPRWLSKFIHWRSGRRILVVIYHHDNRRVRVISILMTDVIQNWSKSKGEKKSWVLGSIKRGARVYFLNNGCQLSLCKSQNRNFAHSEDILKISYRIELVDYINLRFWRSTAYIVSIAERNCLMCIHWLDTSKYWRQFKGFTDFFLFFPFSVTVTAVQRAS